MEAERSNGVPGEDGGNGFAGGGPYAPPASASGSALALDPGFAGTCNTTLVDWIQLVQLGRRDAVLTVRSDQGRRATLWCRSGNIIDASCEGFVGEDAVYRLLAWRTGEVALDFGAVDHRCAIDTPTTGLLIEAMVRQDEAIREESALNEASEADVTADVATIDATAPRAALPGAARRRLEWALWGAGMLLALVLIGAAISKKRAPAKPSGLVAQAAPAGIWIVPLRARGTGPMGAAASSSRRRPPVLPLHPSAPALALIEEVPRVATVRPIRHGSPAEMGAAKIGGPPVDIPPPTKRQPNIRIIEDRQPQVRIIDEHEAHVDVLE